MKGFLAALGLVLLCIALAAFALIRAKAQYRLSMKNFEAEVAVMDADGFLQNWAVDVIDRFEARQIKPTSKMRLVNEFLYLLPNSEVPEKLRAKWGGNPAFEVWLCDPGDGKPKHISVDFGSHGIFVGDKQLGTNSGNPYLTLIKPGIVMYESQ